MPSTQTTDPMTCLSPSRTDHSPPCAQASPDPGFGVVAIGRNEGQRLRGCLESLAGRVAVVVYVDSGSTDGSVELARGLGAAVVELDTSIPFTAARARNAGFERLRSLAPGLERVQFIDGDCQLADGWLDRSASALESNPQVAMVCGRRRERFPEASIYNRMCDIEWNTPIGEARSCGGDFMIRVQVFDAVGGFDPSVIAAEDDELCVRVRLAGWKILRIDADMTWHDVAMHRPGQWWRRARRAGHAFGQVYSMHGRGPLRHFAREHRSVVFWGLIMPAALLVAVPVTGGWSLMGLILYPLLVARVYRGCRGRGLSPSDAAWYAVQCVAAKFPQALGLLGFWWNKLRRRRSTIIEYKPAPTPAPTPRPQGSMA